jgi:hypothetical protein
MSTHRRIVKIRAMNKNGSDQINMNAPNHPGAPINAVCLASIDGETNAQGEYTVPF